MPVFRREQNQVHSMQGNHIAGVATPASGARQVEMWYGRMEANSATPPHSHDTEEVVLFLSGSGRATVAGQELRYNTGDTLILPPGQDASDIRRNSKRVRQRDANWRHGEVARRGRNRPPVA